MNTQSLDSQLPLGPPSAAVESLLRSVAKLCVLGHVSEDVAAQMFREAYRHARSHAATNELRADDTNVDTFAAGQVLSEWHQNSEFLDEAGNPRPLSIPAGEFSALCEKASVEAKPNRLLDLLVEAGTVTIHGDRATANRRELIMDYAHPAAVTRAIRLSGDFASTLHHNLSRNVREPGLFERTVVSAKIAQRQIPSLLAYLSVHGQSLLEDIDSWMSARESANANTTIGVGVYLFVADKQE